MSLEQQLHDRSNSSCETCGSKKELSVYTVEPTTGNAADDNALLCEVCKTQFENKLPVDANHWRCLNDSMWSEVPAVKIIAWRMLHRLKNEGWPQELLDMLYLEDDLLTRAKKGETIIDENALQHIDSNGALLSEGDTVVLIKDLDVKGANFTAKRGTTVKNIKLVDNNAEHIEGRVEGQQIVILTKFVKKG